MREQRSGHIVNISSVGGFGGVPGFGIYNGTKFAVEGVSEALGAEVEPLGIHVTIVEENGNQEGDPRLAARAIISAVEVGEPGVPP